MKRVILFLFDKRNEQNNKEKYEIYLKSTFKERIPDDFKNVPLFSEHKELEDILKFHVLNKAGILSLKRILWVLK